MRDKLLREQEIVSDMHAALTQRQFEVWFQPQYNHSSGALIGAEALVRWRHPQKGLIPPGVFIPVFEQNGFIYEMDKYVWESSCELLHKWLAEGRAPLPVSVNISRYDLLRDDLFDTITGIVRERGIPIELLRLEITESAFAEAGRRVIEEVKRLIDYGFTVEIDDFGSGYSSLNTLKDVPASILKLDMRFLEGDGDTQRGGSIVESIVRMAKWLGMPVIAEGVETVAQADFLRSIGCSYVQGYLYGKPMPAHEYEALALSANKEEHMNTLETVEMMDSNAFWDPKSMDTLVFNSYVGGACIFEYYRERTELLRVNRKFARLLCGEDAPLEQALTLRLEDYMDAAELQKLRANTLSAIETGEESTCEMMLCNLPGHKGLTYLRTTVRVIARAGERMLLYGSIIDVSAQREAERRFIESDERLLFLNDTAHDLLAQDDADAGIDRVLQKTLTYFGAERAFIAEYKQSEGVTTATREVRAPGVPLRDTDARSLANAWYWLESFERQNYLYIEDTGELGDDRAQEATLYRELDARSVLAVPLRSHGGITGALGVVNPTQRLADYDNLGALGDYMATILARRDLIKKIQSDSTMLVNLMNDTPGGFARVRVTPEGGFETVYVNEGFCELLGMSNEEILRRGGHNAFAGVHPDDLAELRQAVQLLLEGNGTNSARVRMRRGDGSYAWTMVSGRVTRNEAGETFMNVYYTDLTERETKELEYREMLPVALEAMMESSADIAFVKDKDFAYICCSRAFARLIGLESEKDIVGKTDFDLFGDVLARHYRDEDIKLFSRGESLIDYVEQLQAGDGASRYVNTSKYLLRDGNGNVMGLYGIGRDITDTRDAFTRLQLLTDSLPCGLGMFELTQESMTALYLSDGAYELLGADRSQGLDAVRFTPNTVYEDDRASLHAQLEAMRLEGSPVDCTYRIRTANGDLKWINLRGVLSGRSEQRVVMNAAMLDVTRQKAAEEALRVHEEEMTLAMSQMGRMICEYDPGTLTLSMPQAYASWYDAPATLTNMPYCMADKDIISDGSREEYMSFFKRIVCGEPSCTAEVYVRRVDGTWHWERYESVTIFSDDGRPIKAIISVEDTTALHDMDSRQREARQLYEHELQLRRALIRDALIYYQLNLTTGVVEEYRSKLDDVSSMKSGVSTSARMRADILQNVAEEDKSAVRDTVFSEALMKAYKRGETAVSLTYRRRLPGLGMRWVRLTANIMRRNGTDEIIAFLYMRNVDAERKDEIALDSILSEEIESVCVLDASSGSARLVHINDGLGQERSVVFQYDEQVKQLISAGVMPEDAEACERFFMRARLIEALEAEPRVTLNYRVKRADGKLLRKRTLAFYLDDTREEIVLSRRDITELYAEEQRQKHALQQAVDAANEANNAKSEFLSRMSHDMRTPLNAVIGLVKLAKEEPNPPRTAEYLSDIDASSDLLLGLINDVLDLNGLETGRVRLNEGPYALEDFKRSISTVIQPLMDEKNVAFDFDMGCGAGCIVVDRLRFNQIFFNLLTNAAKFTQPGGRVSFTAEALPDRGDKHGMRFLVSDNGRGMSAAFLTHLFDPFARERSDEQGAGLGLPIVKRLVDAMDGHISVTSEPGKGSQFIVDLYAQMLERDIGESARQVEAHEQLKGLRVLLVEDNVLNTIVARRLLERVGCTVDHAINGLKALRMYQSSAPGFYGVVLMDLRMPVMTGLEAAREIRALNRVDAHTVPIIAMTADAMSEDYQKTLEAGMNAHIAKPIDPRILYHTIEEQLPGR